MDRERGLMCTAKMRLSRGIRLRAASLMPVLLLLLGVSVLSGHACPDRCGCYAQTVKCQNLDLNAIPHSLPNDTKFLFVTGNNISLLGADSFPDRLEQLTDLYLSGNELESVDAKVFDNLPNLVRLDLSNNNIQHFSKRAFPHNNVLKVLNLSGCLSNKSLVDVFTDVTQGGNLQQLTDLDLSNNNLVIPPVNMLSALPGLVNLSLQNSSIVSIPNGTLWVPPLRDLDLRDNSLTDLSHSTMAELSLKPGLRVRLAGNPWRCDCFIEESLAWLKNSTQVTDLDDLTCSEPEGLRRQPLLRLERSQLECSGVMERVLETSYVFLGLVLALIGVIFLLVLYLNRKGIKRWMYNIRDACRDHMEGYHYRYEINSDPRLANLSINSDV